MSRTVRTLVPLALAAMAGAAASCNAPPKPEPAPFAAALPSPAEPTPCDYPGIHNAVAYHDGFLSGSVPEGDAGFDTLKAMGVRTIISVDGAEPEVAKAAARGMKYIHLPIGYNGFDEQRRLELSRATRDALRDGAVYIHCHHGKHRSAGAAAAVAASLGWSEPGKAVSRMRVSGTSPQYKGLYACAAGATVLAASAIDAAPAVYPSVSRPAGLRKAMVEMDHALEHLKLIENAGWSPPADHPDLVPAAEAGRLADLHRLMADGKHRGRRDNDFIKLMAEGHALAQTLEDMLAAGESDRAKLSRQFKFIAASCNECHAAYRD